MFCDDTFGLKSIKNILLDFFKFRGLKFDCIYSNNGLNFSFVDWCFCKSYLGFYFFETSSQYIKIYKAQLKKIVKGFVGDNVSSLLKILNSSILAFLKRNDFSNSFFDIINEIDVYINKVLWQWAKRRHPRRPNMWIYNKYWKRFNNRWYFCHLDNITGKLLILNSHLRKSLSFYRIPLSLNIFDLRNQSKLNLIWFRKIRGSLKGLYKFLFIKQQGVCSLCRKPFYDSNIYSFKILNVSLFPNSKKVNRITNLVLVHSYCFKV